MNDKKMRIPSGVQDYLPMEFGHKKTLTDRIYGTFTSWGYEGIQTPILEYMDVFDEGVGAFPRNRMFKLVDSEGEILVLRPDITLPITRMYASISDGVQRLCYEGNVFHLLGDESSADLKEFPQQGVELLGENNPQADAEVIALAITALKKCGLTNFMIEIGQVEFFKGLMEEAGLNSQQIEQMRQFVESKNSLAMEIMMQEANLDERLKNRILELPALYGDEEVLKKAGAYSQNERCISAVANLQEIWDTLIGYGVEQYVSIDLGMVQSINYYTGIIFKGLTEGTGYPILNGGRYDNLWESGAATGFAINLKPLLMTLERQGGFQSDEKMRVYVSGESTAEIIDCLARLRAKDVIAIAAFGGKDELLKIRSKCDYKNAKGIFIAAGKERVLWQKGLSL